MLQLEGYDDVEVVGSGGFGVVYRARQRQFDRPVAIKVLGVAALGGAAMARFERECLAMGAVSSHPNIVTVFDSGLTDTGQPYLVMEYLTAGTLAERVEREGALPWRDVVRLGSKLAAGLQAAHEAGVLHRDVKPENVLLSGYGEPKLADFGISRIQGGYETRTGHQSFSPLHAAPEVLAGEESTTRSDVYSLGSLLFVALAGRAAFGGDPDESIYALLRRVANDPLPDLRESGVPPALSAVVEKAMAKDQSERYASAAELGAALDAVAAVDEAAGRTITAPPLAAVVPPASRAAATSATSATSATDSTATDPPAPSGRSGRKLLVPVMILVVALVAGGLGFVLANRSGDGGSGDDTSATDDGAPRPPADEAPVGGTNDVNSSYFVLRYPAGWKVTDVDREEEGNSDRRYTRVIRDERDLNDLIRVDVSLNDGATDPHVAIEPARNAIRSREDYEELEFFDTTIEHEDGDIPAIHWEYRTNHLDTGEVLHNVVLFFVKNENVYSVLTRTDEESYSGWKATFDEVRSSFGA